MYCESRAIECKYCSFDRTGKLTCYYSPDKCVLDEKKNKKEM